MKRFILYLKFSLITWAVYFAIYYYIVLDWPDIHIFTTWTSEERGKLLVATLLKELFTYGIACVFSFTIPKHEHFFTIPHEVNYEGKVYRFHKCGYPGCNLLNPID